MQGGRTPPTTGHTRSAGTSTTSATATSAGVTCGGLPGPEGLQSSPDGSQDPGAVRPGLDSLAARPKDHSRG
eukprot:1146431-Alexandrium_andersonii.AAC.1